MKIDTNQDKRIRLEADIIFSESLFHPCLIPQGYFTVYTKMFQKTINNLERSDR